MNITITRLVSIRIARCCDDAVDKKRVNSCVLQHLFGGSSSTKKIVQISWKFFLQRATSAMFSKNCGWRRKNEILGTALCMVLMNGLIHSRIKKVGFSISRTKVDSEWIQLTTYFLEFMLWKQNNSSIVMQMQSWRSKPAASAWGGLLYANAER